MPSIRQLSIYPLLLAAFGSLPAPALAQLDAAALARLAQLSSTPTLAGDLVYDGVVSSGNATAAPLFTYQRFVADVPAGLQATHITHEPNGQVVVVESATVSTSYALLRFDAINRQLGSSGSVTLRDGGRHLDFQRMENGRLSTGSEDVSEPVVSGPSLHGFILAHWEQLASGKPLAVRMVVLAKMETYGFEIRRLADDAGRATVSITPSSWLVRLAVAPMQVQFDATTRRLLRYEGRVPPMQLVDGKLRDLDAKVDYTMVLSAYR